ncbi:amino acid binding protein [Legionella gratiana]|uniref:Amino acid binding protein n=1 Tax=Legionella gratiana TaxID=45066 RepID=A0A378JHU7_9GAMM|nr:transporter substrate-binding domain-containing protein [Legionella gratiana]KTD11949.1 amino acid binding protein [Legionella gratiana]STX46447.1 amino acid binding protein [Legionella gratiana]
MKLIRHIIFFTLLMSSICAFSTTVKVGVVKFLPPFSSVDTSNHYFGFCIDLLNEVCKRINETCEYIAIAPQSILDELEKGAVDISLTSTPISNELSTEFIFSIPYMTSNGQFITNNSNIKGLPDLQNKKIGVMSESNLENVIKLYTSDENIKEYTQLNNLIADLADNSIDAALLNANIVKYLMNNKLTQAQLVGNPVTLGNGYGILALNKNAALINKVNKALLEIENDGTYETIYAKYFGK